MIIKIIPETREEKMRFGSNAELEYVHVKDYFLMGSKIEFFEGENVLNDFYDWRGPYKFLMGGLNYYYELINEERKDSVAKNKGLMPMPSNFPAAKRPDFAEYKRPDSTASKRPDSTSANASKSRSASMRLSEKNKNKNKNVIDPDDSAIEAIEAIEADKLATGTIDEVDLTTETIEIDKLSDGLITPSTEAQD